MVRIPLSELQQQLPELQFIRIHKSYIVNKQYVSQMQSGKIFIDDNEFAIGRDFQKEAVNAFRQQ